MLKTVAAPLVDVPGAPPSESTVKQFLLSTLCDVSRGLDVIEGFLKVAASGGHSQVPFPLMGRDAQIYLGAQKDAYLHVLEMCSADSLKKWLAQEQAALMDEGVLLEKLQEVVRGFDVLEAALKISNSGDLSQAQFPLVGHEARIHLNARGAAYQHSLEMCDSTSVQALLKGYIDRCQALGAEADAATKITQIIQRKNGSEVRIVATAFFGEGLHRSVGVSVHRRESEGHDWILCSDKPHPDWRSMSVAEYVLLGRSEMLQAVSSGEILRAISLIGRPMSHFRGDGRATDGPAPGERGCLLAQSGGAEDITPQISRPRERG